MFYRPKVVNSMNLSKIYFLLCPSVYGGCLMLSENASLGITCCKFQLFRAAISYDVFCVAGIHDRF